MRGHLMSRVLMIKTRQNHYDRFWAAASPPLGLLYLASYAREKRPGADRFIVVDERTDPQTDFDYRQIIEDFRPDVVALSVLSTEADRLADLVPLMRSLVPEAKILIGGPHATAEGPGVITDFPDCYVVRGEAEVSFVRLLDAFDEGLLHPEERVSGLMYTRADGSLYEVPYNVELPDVPSLPTPAWDLVDFDTYEKHPSRMTPIGGGRYAPLFTSRGCPYRCIYCHDVFGKGFRAYDAKKTVDEIQYLIEHHGVHEYEIYDDIFNADYSRTMAICDEIKRRGLKTRFSFPNGIRGDRLDGPLLQALADVGTYHMAFAIESASPRVQKLIRKHIKLDKIADNITFAAKAGIFTWGFFMLGFPTERREELLATVDFAVTSDLHGAFFFSVIPFGGTELTKNYVGGGEVYESPLFSAENTSDAGDYHYAESGLADVSPKELQRIQWDAYRRFYLRPSRWAAVWRDFPRGKGVAIKKALSLSKHIVVDHNYKDMINTMRAHVLG